VREVGRERGREGGRKAGTEGRERMRERGSVGGESVGQGERETDREQLRGGESANRSCQPQASMPVRFDGSTVRPHPQPPTPPPPHTRTHDGSFVLAPCIYRQHCTQYFLKGEDE